MKIDDFFLSQTNPRDLIPRLNWSLLYAIPEFKALEGCPQHTWWHQEGDVMQHTKNSIVALYEFYDKHKYLTITRELILATAFHDIGKPLTTKQNNEGQWTARNHGPVGARIVREILKDEPDILRRERVCALVRDHMLLHHIFDKNNNSYQSLLKINHSYAPTQDFLLLNYADDFGSTNEQTIKERYARLHEIEKLCDTHKTEKIIRFAGPFCKILRSYGFNGDMNNCHYADFSVIIMVGLPGSGKDTWISNKFPEAAVLSRDDIRIKLGFCKEGEKIVGTKEQETAVTDEFDSMMFDLCQKKESFIINNTNLPIYRRRELVERLIPYKPYIIIVYVDTPIEVCMERRNGQISEKVYKDMVNRFDFPMPYEANRIVRVLSNGKEEVIWDDRHNIKITNDFLNEHINSRKLFRQPWYKRLFNVKLH